MVVLRGFAGAKPALLYLALLSAGGGHGDYYWAKIFFPYTMLSTRIFSVITPTFLAGAIVELPLYGLILSISARAGRLGLAVGVLLTAHVCAVAACFLSPLRDFS